MRVPRRAVDPERELEEPLTRINGGLLLRKSAELAAELVRELRDCAEPRLDEVDLDDAALDAVEAESECLDVLGERAVVVGAEPCLQPVELLCQRILARRGAPQPATAWLLIRFRLGLPGRRARSPVARRR